MSWKSVVGQQQAKDILRQALLSGRVAHAYLFSGPEGSGTEPLAIEFARALVCPEGHGEACDRCGSCRAAAAGFGSPNIHCITQLPAGKGEKSGDPPLAKLSEEDLAAVREQLALKAADPYATLQIPRATTIKVNSIREIRREVSLTGFGSGRKVFLILGADAMNDEASNALLKTLEEPPAETVLLLTAEHPQQLLPTIVSRCQHLRLGPVAAADIAAALLVRGASDKEAHAVAGLAEGSYTRALRLLDSGYTEQRDDCIAFLRSAVRGIPGDLHRQIEEWAGGYDRAELGDRLRTLQVWLREAMHMQNTAGGPAGREDQALSRFVERYRSVSYNDVDRALERAISLLDKNVYIPLILLTLAASLRRSIDTQPQR